MIEHYSDQQVFDTALESLKHWGYASPQIDIDRIWLAHAMDDHYKWFIPFEAVKDGTAVYNRMIVQEFSGRLASTDVDADSPTPYPTAVFTSREPWYTVMLEPRTLQTDANERPDDNLHSTHSLPSWRGADLSVLVGPGERLHSMRRALLNPIPDAVLEKKRLSVEAKWENIRQAFPADMDHADYIEVLGTFIADQFCYWGFALAAQLQHTYDQTEIQHLQEALEQEKANAAIRDKRFPWVDMESARREARDKGQANA